jgi:hypothetical protein
LKFLSRLVEFKILVNWGLGHSILGFKVSILGFSYSILGLKDAVLGLKEISLRIEKDAISGVNLRIE